MHLISFIYCRGHPLWLLWTAEVCLLYLWEGKCAVYNCWIYHFWSAKFPLIKGACFPISWQEIQAAKDENDGSTPADLKPNPVDYIATPPLQSKNQTNATDKASLSKNCKTGFIQKDHSALCRKKGSFFSSKSKRLRIESKESIELKLTWEEAQILLRPAPNDAASVVSVEGHDFEEYEVQSLD